MECFDRVALVDSDCAGPGLIQDGKTRGRSKLRRKRQLEQEINEPLWRSTNAEVENAMNMIRIALMTIDYSDRCGIWHYMLLLKSVRYYSSMVFSTTTGSKWHKPHKSYVDSSNCPGSPMWAAKPGDDAPWSRSRRWKLIRCTFQAGDAYLDGNGPAQYQHNSTWHDWSGEWSPFLHQEIPLVGADFAMIPHHSCIIYCVGLPLDSMAASSCQPWGGVSWWMMLQRQPVRVPSPRVLPMTP